MRADLPEIMARLEALLAEPEYLHRYLHSRDVDAIRGSLDALRALRDAPVVTFLSLTDRWEVFSSGTAPMDTLDNLAGQRVRLVAGGDTTTGGGHG